MVPIVTDWVYPEETPKGINMFRTLIITSALVLTSTVHAGSFAGSTHDFSRDNSSTNACTVCHTHTSALTGSGTVYLPYASNTLRAKGGVQPGATSRLCLACHDGVLASNNFKATGKSILGTNLANDHPIGIVYDAGLVAADGSLHTTTDRVVIGEGSQTKVSTIAVSMLNEGKMECTTCHDVHNTFTADAGKGLVKVSMTKSALCATCHDK
jgi:predicted CXXCH cytochrome family protein